MTPGRLLAARAFGHGPRRPLRYVGAVVGGLILSAMAAAVAIAVAPPLDHRWPLDEASGPGVTDTAGDLDGVLTGGTRVSDGFDGRALRFDGIDDRVVIASDGVLTSAELTISLWVRADPSDPPVDGAVILEKGDKSCEGGAYALVARGDGVAIRGREPLYGVVHESGPGLAWPVGPVWDGEWHHIYIQADADSYTYLSIDGRYVGQVYELQQTGLTTTSLALGGPAAPACGDPSFRGDIDDIRVWDDVVFRDDLAALEPQRPTSLSFGPIAPLTVDQPTAMDLRMPEVPFIGVVNVTFVRTDGVTQPVATRDLESYPLAPEQAALGQVVSGVRPTIGGTGRFVATYTARPPFVDSTVTSGLYTIAPTVTDLRFEFEVVQVAGQPLRVDVLVTPPLAYIVPTGSVALDEWIGGSWQQVGEAPITWLMGSFNGFHRFILPAHPEGSPQFRARYSGDLQFLPTSGTATTDVLPALIPGTVTINGGAAVTDSESVTLSVPAYGATAVQMGASPTQTITPVLYEPELPFNLTCLCYGNDQDGERRVYVRWVGHLNEWSPWTYSTIILDRDLPVGTVAIAGGASVVNQATVDLAVPVPDPSLVKAIRVSNDGIVWTTFDVAPTIAWRLSTGDGAKTVRVRWQSLDDHWSMERSDSVVLSTSVPVTTAPVARLQAPDAMGFPGTVPAVVAWSPIGGAGAIVRYELSKSTNGGAWTSVSTTLTAPSSRRGLTAGLTYRFRVRAIDSSGRAGPWATGPTFRPSALQESSTRLRYSGNWSRSSEAANWGGGARYAKAAGASVKATVTGRTVAWFAPVGPTRGSAKVYVGGVLVATVDLSALSNGARRLVWSRTWTTSATRTVEIRVVGTPGHPRVDVDALVSW